jgi:hypothetical protein
MKELYGHEPTSATVVRPFEGGPDVVYLHMAYMPSPTSTTKRGLILEFRALAGTGEEYLQKNFQMPLSRIKVVEGTP